MILFFGGVEIYGYCVESHSIYYLNETRVNTGNISSKVWFDTTVQAAFSMGFTIGTVHPKS